MNEKLIDFDRDICNRASGELIPDDEPVFILRAKDVHAAPLLRRYAEMVRDREYRGAILGRLEDFSKFAVENPDRMEETW